MKKFNYYLYGGQIKPRADVIDVDLFDTPKKEVEKYDGEVFAYISVGSYETNRPDTADFPKDAIGSKLENWEKERAVDITDERIIEIMKKRIALAKEKGFDGVEFDNVNVYENEGKFSSGFNLNSKKAIEYFQLLSNYAMSKGLKVMLKNCIYIWEDLEGYYDYVLVENAFMWEEQKELDGCKKPIFWVEYPKENETDEEFQKRIKSVPKKYNVIGKHYDLGEYTVYNLDFKYSLKERLAHLLGDI